VAECERLNSENARLSEELSSQIAAFDQAQRKNAFLMLEKDDEIKLLKKRVEELVPLETLVGCYMHQMMSLKSTIKKLEKKSQKFIEETNQLVV
jgi:hypothetical protein